MNTDFYLERGRDHTVCEDFAAAGRLGEQGYALVSDGCSSSRNVDFGARIMLHAAKDNLTQAYDDMTFPRSAPVPGAARSTPASAPETAQTQDPTHSSAAEDGRAPRTLLNAVAFAEATLRKAARVLECFAALPDSTLDATLLLAVVRPNAVSGRFEAQVCLWGDGLVIVRKTDRIEATLLRFAGNAPFYLSYALNAPRRQAYLAQQGGRKELLRVTFDLAGKELRRETRSETSESPLVPFQEQFELETGDSLALVSDGITQFFAADNTPIPWETLAPKFVDYKRPTGVFVRRRMNFFERANREADVRHLDDLSVAAITLLP